MSVILAALAACAVTLGAALVLAYHAYRDSRERR